MDKIRVLIADDHVHEREGFKQLLSLVDSIDVVGEAASAQEAVKKALSLKPDVVLLDLLWYKDPTAGISAIRQIKAETPQIKILAATVYPELIKSARMEGADLAVDKDSLSDTSMLVDRIRDTYMSQGFPTTEANLVEKPTKREMDVLKLMAQGETDREIARELVIALSTSKKHVRSILGKLGARSRGEAIAKAYETGLLRRGTVEL